MNSKNMTSVTLVRTETLTGHGVKLTRKGKEETLILGESKQPQRSLSIREARGEEDDNRIYIY